MKIKFYSLLVFVSLLLASCQPKVELPRFIEAGIGYSNNSVNATVFRNSSVATLGQTQYVAYYDSAGSSASCPTATAICMSRSTITAIRSIMLVA